MEKRVGAFSQNVSKVFLSQSIGIRGTLFGGVKWYVCMYQSSVSCSPRMDCESSNVLLSRKTVLRWRRPCPLVSSEHWPLLWYRVPWQVTQVTTWPWCWIVGDPSPWQKYADCVAFFCRIQRNTVSHTHTTPTSSVYRVRVPVTALSMVPIGVHTPG